MCLIKQSSSEVLILVLVEHTLGATRLPVNKPFFVGLNPCFSGTYSRSVFRQAQFITLSRLNPCFSGTYSRSCPRQEPQTWMYMS